MLISRICRLPSDLVPYLLCHPSDLLPQPQHLLNLLGLSELAVMFLPDSLNLVNLWLEGLHVSTQRLALCAYLNS